MPDYSGFRFSENIEDRRKTPFVPTPGTFGNGIDLGNVFDNGLLTGLKPEDFIQTGPTPLGLALGLGNLETGAPAPSQSAPPSFYKPFGVVGNVTDNIVRAESGGDPNARNPNSSASGLGQFIDSTFLDVLKSSRPDLAQGKTDAELLALKSDPQISRQMTEAYAAQNGTILSNAGHPVTPGNTYLAHFAGPQGAVSVLSADPNTPIDRVLTPAAVKANPFLQGMTAGDLRAWADRKMGGAQPAPVSPAGPANMPLAAPLNLTPQAPPIFAPPPQPQQPQQQAQAQSAPPEAMPMQAPPIFAPQRRQVDLSKLRAAFKAPTFFHRG